jgi:alkyl hydroperoxide reductase subunit AhpF
LCPWASQGVDDRMDPELRERVGRLLARMDGPVTAHVWPAQDPATDGLLTLLRDLAAVAPRLGLVIEDGPPAGVPTPEGSVMELWTAQGPTGIRYLGFPGGYEFGPLLETILALSADTAPAAGPETLARLRRLEQPMTVRVFVAATCPHCPRAVRVAHEVARAVPGRIVVETVDTATFENLTRRAGVQGVPTTELNERLVVVGAVGPEQLVEAMEEAARRPPRPRRA